MNTFANQATFFDVFFTNEEVRKETTGLTPVEDTLQKIVDDLSDDARHLAEYLFKQAREWGSVCIRSEPAGQFITPVEKALEPGRRLRLNWSAGIAELTTVGLLKNGTGNIHRLTTRAMICGRRFGW